MGSSTRLWAQQALFPSLSLSLSFSLSLSLSLSLLTLKNIISLQFSSLARQLVTVQPELLQATEAAQAPGNGACTGGRPAERQADRQASGQAGKRTGRDAGEQNGGQTVLIN